MRIKAILIASVQFALISNFAEAGPVSPTIHPRSVQSADPFCEMADRQIGEDLKAAALTRALDYRGNHQQDVASLIVQAGQNLSQERDHGCPLYKYPISEGLYSAQADQCALAKMNSDDELAREGYLSDSASVLKMLALPECKRENWNLP